MESTDKLIDILERQKKMYEDLCDISKNKTNVIVEGKVQELEKITKVEQALIFKMGDVEFELENTVAQIIKDFGISEKEVTISVIINYLSGVTKSKLEKLKDEMFKLIKELNRLNELNAQLLKNSLDYINFSINLYSNSKQGSNGSYQQNGEISGNKSSFFDVKL